MERDGFYRYCVPTGLTDVKPADSKTPLGIRQRNCEMPRAHGHAAEFCAGESGSAWRHDSAHVHHPIPAESHPRLDL